MSHPLRVGLQEHLSEWTDWDVAAHVLGQSIGVFEEGSAMSGHMAVFWSDNEMGNGLHDALLGLVRAGVLARREEPEEQFRWVR